MTLKTTGIAATLMAGVLILTGCSGGGTAKEELEETPLSKIFMELDPGQDQAYYDELSKKTEELVAACMTEQGFEYQPNTSSMMTVSSSDDEGEQEGPEWGTVEFAKEYGYGIVEYPGSSEVPTDPTEEEYVDPNQEYVESLSESEQTAYYEALHGPSDQYPEEGAEEEWVYDWKKAGCYGAANQEAAGEQAWDSPEMQALQESMEQLYTEQQEDAETLALEAEWASCMTDEGFSEFSKRQEASESMYSKQDTLYSAGSDGEWKEPSKEDKKKFQDEEIEIATAEFTCVDKVDYDKRAHAVQVRLEQAYVDEHKAELDALVSKFATEKKK